MLVAGPADGFRGSLSGVEGAGKNPDGFRRYGLLPAGQQAYSLPGGCSNPGLPPAGG